ncbi:MAG: rod shape-determining protein MreC [bacterium]|nr:rod shape-determining protein MreC [bacterium]
MESFSLKNRVFLIVVALALVFALNLFSGKVRGFFLETFSPVQGFFWDLGSASSRFFSGLFNSASLKKENIQLEERMLVLLQELLSLQSIEKENEQLRETLGLGIEKKFNIISSRIIGKDPSQDILVLDKGRRDGVVQDMAVITPANAAVGRIGEVFETTSRVMLFSHPASSFEAKIVREGVVGATRGQGGYQALLDLIPQESRVVPGDIVVSASLGGIFPEGLLIGEVKEVKTSRDQSFQQATLSLFFDVRKAGPLLIIDKK